MKRAILYTIFCLFLLACAARFILDKGSAKQLSSDKLLITFTSQELKVTYINFFKGKNHVVYTKSAADYPTAALTGNNKNLFFTDFDSNHQRSFLKSILKIRISNS
ncbi:hypothetical protein V3851_20950 [Paenibacillus sp. M1]|mgnify:CR=1 FL=1|uniref:Lipoprotein n=2 Tax=Paenibacillus TaxID=44249 RepID=A0A3P3TXV5_9BACL|nr:hypothetical protein [Paenibacillus oralis]RRJ62952.1 hypothetical protein EHV15_08460 [Paenibacillus oralis]